MNYLIVTPRLSVIGICLLLFVFPQAKAAENPLAPDEVIGATLEAAFRNPPNQYRLVQYGLDRRTLEKYPRYGIGSYMGFFHSYLRNGPMEEIGTLVETAFKQGGKVWLADDFGYPSGSAGGRIVAQNPEYEVRGLAMVTSQGSSNNSVTLTIAPEMEKAVTAVIYPRTNGEIDLSQGQVLPVTTNQVQTRGIPGDWQLCLFGTQIRNTNTQAQSTIAQFRTTGHTADLLNSNAVASFIANMHAPILAQITNPAASVEAFYANEPSLNQLHWKETPAPLACMPWTGALPEKFKQMHGYDLIPQLDALYEGKSAEAQRVRIHFQQTVAELLTVNFGRQILDWCNARGIHSSGHFLLTEFLSMHVACYGDYLKVFAEFDLPAMETGIPNPDKLPRFRDKMGEFITAEMMWKEREKTLCLLDPILACGLNRLSPAPPLIRNAANLALLNGVNMYSAYMPLDANTKGTAAGYTVEEYRALNDYIGRVSLMMQGARPATSVALYYPIAMFQAEFLPSKLFHNTSLRTYAKRQRAFDDTEKAMQEADISYIIVHPEAVAQSVINEGKMKIGWGSYRYLVMPQMEFLPLPVLDKIQEFEKSGGTVLWVDTKPKYGTYAKEDAQVEEALKKKDVITPSTLASHITNPYPDDFNLHFQPGLPQLSVARFRRGDQPLYLLVNRRGDPIKATVSDSPVENMTVYDPITGIISKTGLKQASLKIGGYSSLFLTPKTIPQHPRSSNPTPPGWMKSLEHWLRGSILH
jgi:hypothetical protein